MNRWIGRAVLAASWLLAACGGSREPGAGRPGGTPTHLKIAMIAKSSTNPVFLASRTGAEAAARELGTLHHLAIEIVWLTPPQEDGQVQAQRIQQAVNEGADAILISCSDAGKVTAAIDDAVNRGVAVMTFDSDAPQSKRFAYYGVDDYATGQRTMAELATVMHGRGKVAILAGSQNAPNLQRRVQGAREEAARHPGMTVVGVFNHVETPQDAAAEVLRVNNAYPEINGWAFIGGWPLFTQTLLTDLDPARMKVVSVDALPAQLAYVERGVVPVLLAQSVYLWGSESVKMIVNKLVLHQDVPAINAMALVRVSRDNLGTWARQLRDWGFSDVPAAYLALAH